MVKKMMLVLVLGLLAVPVIFAQEKDTSKAANLPQKTDQESWEKTSDEWWGGEGDTSRMEVKDEWWNELEDLSQLDIKIGKSAKVKSRTREVPFISLEYGVDQIKSRGLFQGYNKNGFAGLKVGRTTTRGVHSDSILRRIERNYLFLGFYNQEIKKNEVAGNLTGNILHFGYNWDEGLGYCFGNQGLQFSNNYGFGWSRLRTSGTVVDSADQALLDYYGNAFRFSIRSAAEAKLQLLPMVSLNAGYERMIMYPRVLFWKAGASILCEVAAQNILDEFLDEVVSSSPKIAPIVSFLLKNGLAYGFSELRKDALDFPFGGVAPIMLDTYKVGISLGL